MSDYKATIGLEIHAELKTQTKMFCNSRNDTDEKRPNVNICPICLGYPGTLPTINKEALKHVIKVGIALGGSIANFTEFDRKNYFYPDIPKGYQISQYKFPLVTGGQLNGIKITRVHLEEDTARSTHEENYSLIDFNRAGIPLMELVTEPVIKSAAEAAAFAKELQLLLQYLGAGEANMEKGEMRVEANISVSPDQTFGTKVEVKNLNSFRAVERAIEFEIKRQIAILEGGEKISQETRGWDEGRGETFAQRSKEYSHDYRYFPDPDLPKIIINEVPELKPDHLNEHLPKLPWERRKDYIEVCGIKIEDAEFFVRNKEWGSYFDSIVSFGLDKKDIQLAANYVTSDIAGLVKGKGLSIEDFDISLSVPKESFIKILQLIQSGKLSSRGAKDILKLIFDGDREDPEQIAQNKGLFQKNDEEELQNIVKSIIEGNKNVVEQYRSGKTTSLQYLIGQAMKATKGSANPEVLKELFIKNLG